MNEEEYLKWKAEIDKMFEEAFKPISKEEYRDQLLDYYSWIITKHTEELNQAVANNQIINHSLDSFYVHDTGCTINGRIILKQPVPYVTFTITNKGIE